MAAQSRAFQLSVCMLSPKPNQKAVSNHERALLCERRSHIETEQYQILMVQETVRYSESIVEAVQTLVNEGTFEHKSEFYRFATELLLDSLREDYNPEMLNYDTLAETTHQQLGEFMSEQSAGSGSMFYESAIIIRRHARRGEIDAAEEYIETHYPSERGEYLLLEALLDYYHDTEGLND